MARHARACTRRRLIASAAAAFGALPLAGCLSPAGALRGLGGGIERTQEGPVIRNAAAARDYCARTLSKRYGFDVVHVGDEPTGENPLRHLVTYKPLFDPSDQSGRVFGSSLIVSTDDGRAESDVIADYAQYYFRDRAERPFREALAGMPGLAGWSARLIYVHRDSRAWGPGDYDAYMGAGTSADPHVEAVLMLPAGLDAAGYARLAAPCFEGLYAMGKTVAVRVGIAGLDYRKSPLRNPDVDEIDRTSRRGTPSEERLTKDFNSHLLRINDQAAWNGNGNPDGRPGDPGSTDCYPVIHWNRGYGPRAS